MNTFVLVYFWILVALIVLRAIAMIIASYPRTVKTTLGADVVGQMIAIGLALWAGFLLWGGGAT
jgi:hypothetical protein